jgi:CheY-like chemotaxis protein
MNTDIAVRPALLLADDNPALLATVVEMLDSGYRMVASLANGASVLDQIDLLNPDILPETRLVCRRRSSSRDNTNPLALATDQIPILWRAI